MVSFIVTLMDPFKRNPILIKTAPILHPYSIQGPALTSGALVKTYKPYTHTDPFPETPISLN